MEPSNSRNFIQSLSVAVLLLGFLQGCGEQSTQSLYTNELQVTRQAYQNAERFLSWRKDDYIRNDIIEPNWIEGESAFWYQRTTADGYKEFIRVNAQTSERKRAFDHSILAAEITRLTAKPTSPDALPFNGFEYNSNGDIIFDIENERFACNENTCKKQVIVTPTAIPGETLSPDHQWAVYFKNDNLWVRSLVDESINYALTTDGLPDNTYGITTGTDLSPITRQRSGYVDPPLAVFSPDNKKLLVQRVDQRNVEQLHLLEKAPADGSKRPKLYTYRFAFALDEHRPLASFVIFDLEKSRRVDVDYPQIPLPWVPHTHPYRADYIKWNSTGTEFYFIHRYDFGKGYAIVGVSIENGKSRVIAERTSNNISVPALSIASNAVFGVTGDDTVVWFSDETGWGHLYHQSALGETTQLTDGAWNVIEILHLDNAQGFVYFLRTLSEDEGNPYHTALARVSLNGGNVETLTTENGVRNIDPTHFSPDGTYFIDNYSSTDNPGTSILHRSNGEKIVELERANIAALLSTNPILPEEFTAIAADGKTSIWGKILKPTHFDPSKRYPVIDAIYPGPQRTRVQHSFSGRSSGLFDSDGEPQALAELGFIVVIVDGRGTPYRSRSFHYDTDNSLLDDAGYLIDHIAANKELAASRPWMDLDRVGIYGHSAGGNASTRAILKHPGFFKVAVSSAGSHDPRISLPIWAESYLGVDDYEKYLLASNPEIATNLEGKLLLLVGDMDDNVHPAGTYQLVDALIKNKKDFDLLSLPGASHNYAAIDPGDKVYAIDKTWDYFVEHLMGATPPRHYVIEEGDSNH